MPKTARWAGASEAGEDVPEPEGVPDDPAAAPEPVPETPAAGTADSGAAGEPEAPGAAPEPDPKLAKPAPSLSKAPG